MFEIYRVTSGDCLWDIAKARFGYAQFWPGIYSFNNWAAAHQISKGMRIFGHTAWPTDWMKFNEVG